MQTVFITNTNPKSKDFGRIIEVTEAVANNGSIQRQGWVRCDAEGNVTGTETTAPVIEETKKPCCGSKKK
jgi:hypothetical protein